jgi:hypothetical protein
MKISRYFIFLSMMIMCFNIIVVQAQEDKLGIGKMIEFSSEKYQLTRMAKPYNNYFIQEYIRPSENTDNFTKSVVVMAIIDSTSTDQLLGIKMKELDKMKEKNKTLKYNIFADDKEGRMIEFSIYDEKYYYWNIQRYEVQTTKLNEMVGFMYTYVERFKITEKDTPASITAHINEKKISFINEISIMPLPKINF